MDILLIIIIGILSLRFGPDLIAVVRTAVAQPRSNKKLKKIDDIVADLKTQPVEFIPQNELPVYLGENVIAYYKNVFWGEMRVKNGDEYLKGIDSGILYISDKSIIFHGQNVSKSIKYSGCLNIQFKRSISAFSHTDYAVFIKKNGKPIYLAYNWLENRHLIDAATLYLVFHNFYQSKTKAQSKTQVNNTVSRRISQSTKDLVWNRDNGKCVECGSNEKLEFDHIIPFSKGGSNSYRNIQLLCESCNRKKSDKIG